MHRPHSSAFHSIRPRALLALAILASPVFASLPLPMPAGEPPAPPPQVDVDFLERRKTPSTGYYDPNNSGGAMLTLVNNTYPPGLHEPINVIMSAYSDWDVLQPVTTDGGLINWFQSVGFSTECLGQHSGDNQAANLGDGHGYLNQTAVIRWDYGDATVGTCEETIEGGDHIRYWIQNGPSADSGAVFMALSYEMPIAQQHNIVPNGYNLGRDWFVGNATAQSSLIPSLNVTNASSYSGETTFNGYTYSNSVTYVSGLLQNTSIGINHNDSVPIDGKPAIDGLVAVVEVKIVGKPANSGALPQLGFSTSLLTSLAIPLLLSGWLALAP
ncbi:hypothetical protein CONPUDRAFT_113204 [Coniophora puteana RWD-64-598 SS2]|uniref:Uncharacterized protein n=1 Tax=Coniophora puteana (strain RWD-64-598) TaxID=741705 RepID=R7SEP1_CONPW|nr:uncharacterized protein CONPUDRAFT_113204 [Coniophora puteana RWD-64-598 SS2]EIW74643.1 hypothetical protein CONPUDRAFT_113204 [Coniophora puteana RWD-64-598 SS2]